MKGLQLVAYGDAAQAVKLVDVPDFGPPQPDEIVIDVEASPIEPTDQYIIAGIYGELPPLPHLLGCQGVGRVSAVGRDVKHVKAGDRTLVPMLSNAWVSRVKTNAAWLRALPDGDGNQLAMLGMNPVTAYLLLTEFVTLKPGEWIISTAANSAVARSIIPIARAHGFKTLNIVRRPELIDELKTLGGDVVLVDGPDLAQRVATATGNAKISLALDGIGGATTQRLVDSVGLYGKVVIWSRMGGESSSIETIPIIFTGKSLHGFWIVNWLKVPGNPEQLAGIYENWRHSSHLARFPCRLSVNSASTNTSRRWRSRPSSEARSSSTPMAGPDVASGRQTSRVEDTHSPRLCAADVLWC
jgi:NADPH:quinone reductase-like Zn-dependent oxidoreductase